MTWWQILIGAIVGLLILTILVVLHELGHAITAKRNGVEVEEFGIGFPPRAKSFGVMKSGPLKGTLVTLNWLPIGGFCKMHGESDDDKRKGTYGAASLWAKTKILLAGVTVNFLTACVIFTILAFFGIPVISKGQFAVASDNHGEKGVVDVYSVVKDSPADKAGLKKGDILKKIDGQDITMSTEVPEITKAKAGQTIKIEYNREDEDAKANCLKAPCNIHTDTVSVKLPKEDAGKGRLGITTEQKISATIKATWSAPLVGIVNAAQFFWLTLASLWNIVLALISGAIGLFTGAPNAKQEIEVATSGVSGPVGILGQIFPAAVMAGPTVLLYVSGIIAISLSVMNLLPIPGLDGGRLYLTLWYHARRRTLTKEREEEIVGRGMTFLFILIIVVTVADILRYVL